MIMIKKLFVTKNLEYTRGVLSSILSAIFSQIMIFLSQKTKIKHKETVLYILTFIVANLISYSADILLAKSKFDGKIVPLSDFKFRLNYLLTKLFSYQIVKFFILVAIDVKIVKTIYDKIILHLDSRKINFTYRNQLVLFLLTSFTFLLYGNMLRFNWVYEDEPNLIMDTLMFTWLTIIWL